MEKTLYLLFAWWKTANISYGRSKGKFLREFQVVSNYVCNLIPGHKVFLRS
jgi:hypothetical protein